MKHWQIIFATTLLLISGSTLALLFGPDEDRQSICFGSTSNGHLKNGVPLALSGSNFKSYTILGKLLRRTYVHSTVKSVVETTYHKIYISRPDLRYMYGETGFPEGGRFKPHRTHQNGLSVDFITPVLNQKKQSVYLPTHIFNQFGYKIDFNNKGQYRKLSIDFNALGLHLKTLDQTARVKGIWIQRVFFDPRLQPALFNTEYGPYLKAHLKFNSKRQWVRHDDHYHVDFVANCHG